MAKISKISFVLVISISVIAFLGCNSGQKQNKETKLKEEMNTELLEMQDDLKQKASEEFSNINDKVRELNSKMEENAKKLTEEQNKLLDEIQEKRVDLNNRLNNIKNVSEEEWENFSTTFKEDLEEIKTKLDEVLADF